MSTPYQHRGLATKATVRLIQLQESMVENRIACTIRHDEQSTAVYDALSYEWGDPRPTRGIFIRDFAAQKIGTPNEWKSLDLHENLWQFLYNAWRRRMFDRWLWTDCICLNQDDEIEKNEQIPQMAEIYHNAVRVIAWLRVSASQERHLLPVRDCLRNGALAGDWPLSFRVKNHFSDESIHAASALILAEYWHRVWVVQELASAKSIICFIGNLDLTFDEMKNMSVFRNSAPYQALRGGHTRAEPFWLQGVIRRYAEAPDDTQGPKLDLWSLLKYVTYQRFKSQRPHDLVYGILGLTAPLADGTSPADHIKVNYNKHPADLFLDAIFVSDPEWGEFSYFKEAIEILQTRPVNAEKWVWEPIFTLLTRYAGSDSTSQRHKELAGLVLSVADALYFIMSTSGLPTGCHSDQKSFRRLPASLRSECSHKRIRRTAQHGAVLFGAALAFAIDDNVHMKHMVRDWEACRQFRVAASSPWRCDVHQPTEHAKVQLHHGDRPSPDNTDPQIQMASYIEWYHDLKKKLAAADTRDARGIHCSAELEWAPVLQPPFQDPWSFCRHFEKGSACSGSSVTCDFPEADFRLKLSYRQHSRGKWRAEKIHASFGVWFITGEN